MNILDLLLYKLPILVLPFVLFLFLLNGIKKELWSLKWVGLALAVSVFWFLNPILLDSSAFPVGELSLIAMIQSGWESGILSLADAPFWVDYFGNGHPLHADVLSGFFYPFNWLYLILDVNYAVSWSVALHFWFAAIFFAILTREFGLSKTASYAAGFVYVMNEWVLWKISSPILLYQFSSMWLPIAILYLTRYMRGKDNLNAMCGLPIALAFSFITFFNIFMYNIITLFIFFAVYVVVYFKDSNFRNPLFLLGIGVSVLLFFLLISSTLLPTYELVQNTSNTRISSIVQDPGGLWPCYPRYCRSMGLSIPMMIDTFLARKDLLFGTHFGAGKLAALLMVLGLFWIFIKNKLKTAIFFYACMVCVLIIGILVVRKTTVYYFLRQFLPFFDRTTLMPTALLLLVFAVSGLCALGADFILFVSERILNRAKQRYHGLPKEMITSVICIALVTGITAWNMRFMKFPTYDYDKRLADYPHLREAARLIDHPLARLFMLGNSSWFTAWQGKIFVDYGIRSFNINRGITTIKESSVITNDAQAMDPAFSRFLSLAGVQYILSANKEDDLDLVKTVVWKNWRTHNEAFDIRQLSGEKTIYVYEPKLPPKERYRIYRDAILIVGDPGHTGKIALMLMNNESIDPLHTLILEITRNVLSNIDSKLWDFIDLVVDTDRTGDTGSIMDIKKRKIPVVDVVEIRDHAHLLKGRQSDVVPVIEHGNSYAVLDVSGLPAGILFAANTYYMGWQSVVGNKKNQAMKANYAFQGYIIDHPDIVRLKFWPGKIYFGMLLSCIGVLVICGLIIYGRLLSNVSAVINE